MFFIVTLNGILPDTPVFLMLTRMWNQHSWTFKQSGVQGNFSNFTEFSLLLFSCNIQNYGSFLSEIFLAVPLSIFIWTLFFVPLSFLSLSLFYSILMEFYSILFVSIQCGTVLAENSSQVHFENPLKPVCSILFGLYHGHIVLAWYRSGQPQLSHFTCCS